MKKITKAELAKRNAAFNALSPMKKRVAVAKDILLQLKAGTFVAGDGYGNPKSKYCDYDTYSYFPVGNLQVAAIGGLECEGCAKAACIISKAKLGNDVVVGEDSSSQALANAASYSIFGDYCADIIETLYEGSEDTLPWDFPKGKELAALRKYIEALPDRDLNPTERMTAIYQNIVTNRGRLVIGDYKY